MSTYIDISSTASRQAAQTRSAIDGLQNTLDEFDRLKAIFDQMAMGGDWVSLGGFLGVTAAEAEAVYNTWGSAVAELHGTFIGQLLARCG